MGTLWLGHAGGRPAGRAHYTHWHVRTMLPNEGQPCPAAARLPAYYETTYSEAFAARNTFFCTLPMVFLGSSAISSTRLGIL
jgi:hypothetical protein